MKFQTPYTIDDNWSAMFGTDNREESMTQQSDQADSDINIIMERYGATGQLPQVNVEPLYGDFTEVGDYRTAVERITAAREAFDAIPAKVRAEFGNDPQAFIAFASDPNNGEQMQKWGLTTPKPPKETTLDDIAEILRTPKETKDGNQPNTGKN